MLLDLKDYMPSLAAVKYGVIRVNSFWRRDMMMTAMRE